ncbi:plasmid mobilization protein [Streptomyces sp. NPDC016845]|uniref:plasmid mobilization protein n=1 Tax=Streptomyces sp. NPDC016845 TaxID=3364972 RepID=UPI0037B7C79E
MDGTALLRELFTPDEYEAVRGHADHLGVTVAEYVRRTAAERALGRLQLTEAMESRAPHLGNLGALGNLGKASIPQVDRVRCAGGTSSPALDRFLDTLAHPTDGS